MSQRRSHRCGIDSTPWSMVPDAWSGAARCVMRSFSMCFPLAVYAPPLRSLRPGPPSAGEDDDLGIGWQFGEAPHHAARFTPAHLDGRCRPRGMRLAGRLLESSQREQLRPVHRRRRRLSTPRCARLSYAHSHQTDGLIFRRNPHGGRSSRVQGFDQLKVKAWLSSRD